MGKKYSWKYWVSRSFLLLLIAGAVWLTNLIWFAPFNIRHFYEKVFVELVLDNPEMTTSLGIPILYDLSKGEFEDISDAKQWANLEKAKKDYETLLSYDFEKQTKENQLNTRILAYYMKQNTVDAEPYFYYGYPVNQMSGIQSGLPSFMVSAHKLEDKSDVDAYIARLSKFPVKFAQLTEGLKISESKNIIPPRFIISMVLDEMKGFTGLNQADSSVSYDPLSATEKNILYTHFTEKIDQLATIPDQKKSAYKKKVAATIEDSVFPAYKDLINYFEQLYAKATNDAGVWKFPDGDAYYRYRLKASTTTDLGPEEIHQLGLSEVARIKQDMIDILRSQGLADSTKTLGEIIQTLNQDEHFLYPGTDEGREMIKTDFQNLLSYIKENLDEAFEIQPKASLEVERVPPFKEEGSPIAYYDGPNMDGSRGGTFYINLRKPEAIAKYGMKTLAYHEGIPGHHFQVAIQRELKGLPTFRTVIPFTAYAEGWALYAEQLAWELGFYKNDPFGNLGRLQAEIWRAVRLVVDSGIHFKKWTREEAIDYMLENTGMDRADVITEIERYIVMPGQACSYKVGMMKILELREKAKQRLGNKFSLPSFHNAVLKNGAVPLEILEAIIDDYINETLAGTHI